jgi:hypothetical protein
MFDLISRRSWQNHADELSSNERDFPSGILSLGIQSRMPFGIVGLHVYTFVIVLGNLLWSPPSSAGLGRGLGVGSGPERRPSRARPGARIGFRRPKCSPANRICRAWWPAVQANSPGARRFRVTLRG